MINGREAGHPVDEMFLERWSPRAFDGAPITEEELMTVLEAGRWAPSSFNSQPWRFVYALHGGPSWEKLLGLLIPYNQEWAKNAGALVFTLSKRDLAPDKNGVVKASYSHSFDSGSAWAYAALQASKMGMRAHGMTGFDHERAPRELGVPEGYRVEMVFAVGRIGDTSTLSESLQAKETRSPRRPLRELVSEGTLEE